MTKSLVMLPRFLLTITRVGRLMAGACLIFLVVGCYGAEILELAGERVAPTNSPAYMLMQLTAQVDPFQIATMEVSSDGKNWYPTWQAWSVTGLVMWTWTEPAGKHRQYRISCPQ